MCSRHSLTLSNSSSSSYFQHHPPPHVCSLFPAALLQVDIGRKLDYFLCTGNLISESGLDLQQNAGFTIVAERLNYWRFISHFRSIHRWGRGGRGGGERQDVRRASEAEGDGEGGEVQMERARGEDDAGW